VAENAPDGGTLIRFRLGEQNGARPARVETAEETEELLEVVSE
jgi:hypothetical protein